ncbi:MAG: NapC/NirT family cytochrome c, partial [Gemmatimonadota bacterium]|nr:NapC/NirT family cytochrome c [Gemmatimonadota bacterium]
MTILFRVSSLLQEHTLSDRADSTQVESPLPGGVAELVRFLFEVPQWVQTIGAVIGVISFVALAILVWKRRESVITWITTRSDKTKWAIAVVTGFVVITAGTTGAVSWNYMQHDNDFCTGCHVMGEAYQRFTASEHDTLNCHDCH